MKLKGRTAIVTGASRGIGLAISQALLARGARVAGFARDAGALRKLSRRLGENFFPVRCDVGDLAQVRRAVRAVWKKCGAIDILVNNAGVGHFGAVDRLPKKQWDEMLATNVSGVFHCTRETVPLMKAKRRGQIVNIASLAGMRGYPNASGYNATKFAVRGLSDALAKELAPQGIRVCAIFPGATRTGFGRGIDANTPALRPDDVAAAVLKVLESAGRPRAGEVVLRPRQR